MKKNLTKKLMLSVLTLAFAVVSLGASTFAWFTMSSNAKVSAFQGTVKGAEGIEIAITAIPESTFDTDTLKWYSGVLPSNAIKTVVGKVQFDALTSSNGVDFSSLDHNTGTLKPNATEGFIEFRLWFKAGAADTLSLTTLNIAGPSTVPTPTIDQDFLISADDTGTLKAEVGEKWAFNVASAARVSFQPKGESSAMIYELSAVSASEGVAGNSEGFDTVKGAFAYYNAKVEDEVQKLKPSIATKPTQVFQNGDLAETKAEADDIISLETDVITYVDVRVWIEGWDGECLNSIFDQVLTIDFEFFLKSKLA